MRVASCVLVLASLVATVRADPEPWKQGVTAQQMAAAQKLLEEGNAVFVQRDYKEALAKYEQAIAIYDHPAIRFNVVRCLIQLDRPIEAADNLEAALRYGSAPLEDSIYADALAYQKLLAQQIATVEVACSQPGVEVTLDGQPLATCPATSRKRVLPGHHEIVARRTGYLTRTVDVIALGGATQRVPVSVDPLGAGAKIVHRWPGWKPWAVVGGGVFVAGVGGWFESEAVNARNAYSIALVDKCGGRGCTTDPDPADRSAARRFDVAGVTTMAVGAAVVVTGAVLVYLNRGRTVYPNESLMPTVAPAPGGATVGLAGRF